MPIQAQREDYPLSTSALDGGGRSTPHWPLYPRGTPTPTAEEDGWVPGPVWMGMGKRK